MSNHAPPSSLCYGVYISVFQASMSTTMTVRLEDDVKDRLERLAASTQRSKSFLAAEARLRHVG
jgi:hypothetical protein